MKKAMSENDVKKAVLEYLTYSGFYVLRLNSGKLFANYGGKSRVIQLCPNGTPDIFCIIKGVPVFFELKSSPEVVKVWQRKVDLFKKTARVNEYSQREIAQYQQMEKIRKAGGYAFIISSVSECEAAIKSMTDKNDTKSMIISVAC